jgi:hypothetical protein
MPNEYVLPPDLANAAGEFVCGHDKGCIVSIWELLEELRGKFGDRLPVSPDNYGVLDLTETLLADPHVDQVPSAGSIEFAWRLDARAVGGDSSA